MKELTYAEYHSREAEFEKLERRLRDDVAEAGRLNRRIAQFGCGTGVMVLASGILGVVNGASFSAPFGPLIVSLMILAVLLLTATGIYVVAACKARVDGRSAAANARRALEDMQTDRMLFINTHEIVEKKEG